MTCDDCCDYIKLLTAKEENERLKSGLSTIDKLFAWTIEENTSIQDYFSILRLEIENSLFKNEALIKQTNSLKIMLSDTLSENKSLTQQNKQMREALEEIVKWYLGEDDEYKEYEENIAQIMYDIAQQALKGRE